MGAALVLAGCAFQAGFTLHTVKLMMVWVFIYLTGPAATHALAKAAYSSGLTVVAKREDRSQVPAPPPEDAV
jgi:multicomponent Na+:H+ antiporter subunit G